MGRFKNKDISVPGNLNIFLACVIICVQVFLIWFLSHNQAWYWWVSIPILFGLFGNTNFGLMHEAAHGHFHTKKSINHFFGTLLAAMFPAGYHFMRSCHLNHHRHNRTDFETFEAYHENDSKPLKVAMLYFILTGLYWLLPPLGSLWLMISPKTLINSNWSGKRNYKVGRMGGAGMLRHLESANPRQLVQMRLEVLFSLLVQISLFLVFNYYWLAWLACTYGFAFMWSGIQYADHAYTARDVRNGAWNLKVPWLIQKILLDYNHHKAHHQYPNVPWIHLHKFVDFNEHRPHFMSIYLRMWKGIEKTTVEVKGMDDELEKLITTVSYK
jgi:fatty acid desaturase